MGRETNKQTKEQKDRQTDKQRQTDRQTETDRQTDMNRVYCIVLGARIMIFNQQNV